MFIAFTQCWDSKGLFSKQTQAYISIIDLFSNNIAWYMLKQIFLQTFNYQSYHIVIDKLVYASYMCIVYVLVPFYSQRLP